MSSSLWPLEIARLEEARQADGISEVARESEVIAGGRMSFDGPKSWANLACGLGLDGPVSDDDLDRLVSFFVSRGVEPQIETCAFADGSLIEGLARRGFVLREFENALVREIRSGDDYRAELPHGWPDGIGLEPVDPADAAAVDRFIEVSSSGFRKEGEPLTDDALALARRVVRHPLGHSLAALEAGSVVGGGTVECRGDVGAFFGASVLPTHRRRGIQLALIAARLERARDEGCRIGVVHSRPGIPTERNATRLGFRLAYTKALLAMPGPGLVASS